MNEQAELFNWDLEEIQDSQFVPVSASLYFDGDKLIAAYGPGLASEASVDLDERSAAIIRGFFNTSDFWSSLFISLDASAAELEAMMEEGAEDSTE